MISNLTKNQDTSKFETVGPDILSEPTLDIDAIEQAVWIVYKKQFNHVVLLQLGATDMRYATVLDLDFSTENSLLQENNVVRGNIVRQILEGALNAEKLELVTVSGNTLYMRL